MSLIKMIPIGTGSSINGYTNPMSEVSTSSLTFTISNKKGSKLLVLLFYHSGSSIAYNNYDGATCTGGTITKLCNLKDTSGTAAGTFYNLDVTSDTCVITAPSAKNCFYHVFEASLT